MSAYEMMLSLYLERTEGVIDPPQPVACSPDT